MSNPISILRHLASPGQAAHGVVVEAADGIAKVATIRGLAECPANIPLRPGDLILIGPNGEIDASLRRTDTYWM